MTKKQKGDCPVPEGILVIIGGKENKGQPEGANHESPLGVDKLEIQKRFIELIGKEDPLIEVITSASGDPEGSFEDYRKLYESLGIKKIGHIHHKLRKEVLDEEMVARAQQSDAFFFSGGDQLLLSSLYGGTPFLTEIKKRFIHDNIVIGGTSAGAMAMSTPMIYAGSQEVQQIGGEIKVTTGLEFLKDVCIDTHFVNRGRFIRLAQVIATNATCTGMGIEEDTAVIVRQGVEAEVIGSGTVILIEGFEISSTNIHEFTEKKTVSIRDLKVHILGNGDSFRIKKTNPQHT
jgi:cyanophycinase